MRLCLFSAFVGTLIGVMAVGLLRAGPAVDQQPSPSGPVYAIELHDNYFDPPGLFLPQPGESVTWVWVETGGGAGHSVTAYHPSQDKELRIPEAAKPWNSDVLKKPGSRFTLKLTVPGVYDYFCIPHEDLGMVGRLIVKEATGPGTKPLDKGISAAGQSVMPTIEEILGLNGQIFNLLARLNGLLFLTQQNHRDQALTQLKSIQQDWQAGVNQPGSLYEALKSIGLDKEFSGSLFAIEYALQPGGPIGGLPGFIRQAKDTLNKAMSQLSQHSQ